MTYNDYLKEVMNQNGVTLDDGIKPTQANLKELLDGAGIEYMTKGEFDSLQTDNAREERKNLAANVDFSAAMGAIQVKLSNMGKLRKRLKDAKEASIKRELIGELEVEQKRIEKVFEKTLEQVENCQDAAKVLEFLKWSRQRRLVKDNTKSSHLLNALLMESVDDDNICECFVKPPVGLRAEHGAEYKYTTHWDKERQQDVYTTFITVEKTGEEQLTKEATQKINRGIPLTEDDYLPNRIDVKTSVLKHSEWSKYFRPI